LKREEGMSKYRDLTGQKFGRLTVIAKSKTENGRSAWLCNCDCGRQSKVQSFDLINGKTKSCGCLQGKRSHGLSRGDNGKHMPLYKVWVQMRQRCLNANNVNFKNYGGRGIKIYKEWESYKNFYDWAITSGYEKGLTIERINNDGNYDPANCTWIPQSKQPDNLRSNRYITFNGANWTLRKWGRITGINARTIGCRIDRGWSTERALTQPVRRDVNASGTIDKAVAL